MIETYGITIAIIFFIFGIISEIHYQYSYHRINNLLHEYRQDYIKIEYYPNEENEVQE